MLLIKSYYSFTRKLRLTEFFRSADTNENENNATSEKSLVRDKSSFCPSEKQKSEIRSKHRFSQELGN